MSHFTAVQVIFQNGPLLLAALQGLGYKVETNTNVRGYQGNQETAEYVIRQSNGYDLGFRKKGDKYELVADFWGAKIDQEKFVNSITQSYSHLLTKQNAESLGFSIENEETREDGSIVLVLGKWR